VVDFKAPDPTTLGLRQFRFESPEPKDPTILTSAYPQGAYTFNGTTVDGRKFHGESTLSHALPAATSFIHPKAEAKNVNAAHCEITWVPVKIAAAYIIYVEQDRLDVNVTARLSRSMTSFTVPDGFLRPGTEYTLGIGTVSKEGNVSFVETTFTTAGKR
jgi:hypothetical protein